MHSTAVPIKLAAKKYTPHCATCRVASICAPLALEFKDVNELDAIMRHENPVQKNEYIYRENDDFSAVYAVRSGSVKLCKTGSNGDEQVMGFYFPGEIFGVDGLSTNAYQSSASAMETASVCKIDFNEMTALSQRISSVQRYFFNIVSGQIAEDQQHLMWLGKRSAEQRIILLLLAISSKYARQKMSETEFYLPMSRSDIANYAGLTIETVSRVLGKLQENGTIRLQGRGVTITDLTGMKNIAYCPDEIIPCAGVTMS